MDMTQSEYNLTVEEADLVYYTKTFKDLKPSHRDHTRMILIHIEDDMWEFRVVGLTSREWLEFCAYVYAEIPSSPSQEDVEEAATEWPTSLPADSPLREMEPEGDQEVEEEPEYEDDDTEPVEEEVEDSTNPEGENPGEEVQRKLRKAVLVKKTKDSAVTVEED